MKKTTHNPSLKKRLTQYGALSTAILGITDATGQIVYTDVNPDFAGGLATDYFIDLNNDGTDDFRIFHDSDDDLYMSVLNSNNDVLGSASVFGSPGYYSAYIYPFALDSGVVLSNSTSAWYNSNDFYNAYTTLNWNSCLYGNWCSVVDKFLGLRFEIGGNIHYGWLRMDVDANGDNWVVKDYAYEATPNAPITTGQTLSVTDFEAKARVSCVDRIITISRLQGNASYRITSVTGQVILEGTTRLETQEISLENLSSGVYVVEVSDLNSDGVIRKKIAI